MKTGNNTWVWQKRVLFFINGFERSNGQSERIEILGDVFDNLEMGEEKGEDGNNDK